MAASKKQVEELQRAHDQKIKEQKIIEEKRKLMESRQKQVLYNKELSRVLLQKEHSNSLKSTIMFAIDRVWVTPKPFLHDFKYLLVVLQMKAILMPCPLESGLFWNRTFFSGFVEQ